MFDQKRIAIEIKVFYDLAPVKTSIFRSVLSCLLAVIVSFITGCGRNGSAPKIDVQAQVQNLSSADADTRANACAELAKAGPAAAPAIQQLIGLLKDPDPVVRRLAAYVLGEIGPAAKDALPALKGLLNEPDRQLIASVVIAIRAIDPANNKDIQPPLNVTQ